MKLLDEKKVLMVTNFLSVDSIFWSTFTRPMSDTVIALILRSGLAADIQQFSSALPSHVLRPAPDVPPLGDAGLSMCSVFPVPSCP